MQSLSRAIGGICRRRNGGRVGCVHPLRWPPPLAQQDAPLMAAASALLDRHLDLQFRFLYGPWSMQRSIGARWEKWHSEEQLPINFASASTKSMETGMRQEASTKCMNKAEIWKSGTNEFTDNNIMAEDDIWFPQIYARDKRYWEGFNIDITDRNETLLEPVIPDIENCVSHPCNMMQIFSMTLVECPIDIGPVQLYGYIAVRDDWDYKLNYVFNCSRDEPTIMQQASPIKMSGPKRGIEMICPVLMEFDLRVKNAEEDNDLQLIDGIIVCSEKPSWKPLKYRICGNTGAVDITWAVVEHAVEATIEVVISEVQTGFSLSLSSFVDIITDEYQEIQLFHGTIGESCALRRFVVAVTVDTFMILQLKVGDSNDKHFCTFMTKRHGCDSQKIRFEHAYASVKVIWST